MPKTILKVKDAARRVTDPVLLSSLAKQNIPADEVEFCQDYAPAFDKQGRRQKEKSPYAKFYRHLNSDKLFTVISQLPMVDGDGNQVEAAWEPSKDGWRARVNCFGAEVAGKVITLECLNDQPDGKKKGARLQYTPQLFVSGEEINPSNEQPDWLETDPLNGNYHQNVLEWDYGQVKRWVRLIEGQAQGFWLRPVGLTAPVRIKYNQSGDYRLRLGIFRNGDDEEFIPSLLPEYLPLQRINYNGTEYYLIYDSATYSPDAHTESTTVDGQVGRASVSEAWATIEAGAGNNATDSGTGAGLFVFGSSTTSNQWVSLQRAIALFAISLPPSAIISAAVLSFYGYGKLDNLAITPTVNIYSSNPASNTALVAADFTTLGATAFATAIAYAAWNTSGYNDFTFNASGLAAIPLSGIAKLGCREATYDAGASTPTWSSDKFSYMQGYFAEQGTGYKPKLVITYTAVVAPTVTESAATDITANSCTGNGNITDTGGENCTRRGFCYKSGLTGDPTTADSLAYEDGSFGTGAYTLPITGLTPGSYRMRAYAVNSAGTGYSSTIDVIIPDCLDGYSEANKDSDSYIAKQHPSSDPTDISSWGQGTTGGGTKLYNCKFYLKRVGNPGNLIARLYAHTGTWGSTGKPTGAALASSSVKAASTISNSAFELVEFTGFSDFTPVNGTHYFINLESYDGTWNTSNYVIIGADASSPTHAGNRAYYRLSNWNYESTWDLCFYLNSIFAVTTQAPGNVQSTTAVGNGNITGLGGGGSCDHRGIVYDTASRAAPGNVAPAASGYALYEDETGAFNAGAFTRDLTSLVPGATYYARAYAHNADGYAYGDEVIFTATPIHPLKPRNVTRLILVDSSGQVIAPLPTVWDIKPGYRKNELPTLEFTVPGDIAARAYFTDPNEIWRYQDNVLKDMYRITAPDKNNEGSPKIKVECQGFGCCLKKSTVITYSATTTVTAHATALLALQETALITLGGIDPALDISVKLELSMTNVWAGFMKLRDTVGGYLYFTFDASSPLTRKIWLWSTQGSQAVKQIRKNKDLLSVHHRTDYNELFNKLYPYGDASLSLTTKTYTKITADKSSDATYGYLTLKELYAAYKDWTAPGDALPANVHVYKPTGSWVLPTSHTDDTPPWYLPALAYDGNEVTSTIAYGPMAGQGIPALTVSSYLIVNRAAITTTQIRVYNGNGIPLEVEVYYGGAWHSLTGGFAYLPVGWNTFTFSSSSITSIRVRLNNNTTSMVYGNIGDIQIWDPTGESDDTANWKQGVDERTLRIPIASYSASTPYVVSYTHAAYLIYLPVTSRSLIYSMPKIFTTSDVDALLSLARTHLASIKTAPVSMTVNMVDVSVEEGREDETKELGDLVRIISEDLGIDETKNLVQIEHPDIGVYPERIQVSIDNSEKTLVDKILEME